MTELQIHKYRLPFKTALADAVNVPVRSGRLLHLAVQHGDIHIWAAVNETSDPIPTRFRLIGTGSSVDASWIHLGTVLDGDWVWHIFTESTRIAVRDVPESGPPQ